MPELTPCAACSELVLSGACVCPHCGSKACRSKGLPGIMLLLGLSLAAGCVKSQALYGAPVSGLPTETADTADTGTTTQVATDEEHEEVD